MTASSTRPGPAPHAPRTTPAHAVTRRPDDHPPAPCTTSYRRLGRLFPALRVHSAPPRAGDGWIHGTDLLADPDALRELIAHDERQGLARYGRPLRPDVAAGFGLHRFTWPAALLFTLPWFLERRVPLLAPGDVSIRRASGELTARPGAFVCLPGDPAAGLPGARTVADEAALAAELRTALAGFLAPVLTAFRPRCGAAADALGDGDRRGGGGALVRRRTARRGGAGPGRALGPARSGTRGSAPAGQAEGLGAPGTPGAHGVHARRVRLVHPRCGLRGQRRFGHRPCPGQLLPRLHRPARGDVRRLPPRHAGLTAAAFEPGPGSPEFRETTPFN